MLRFLSGTLILMMLAVTLGTTTPHRTGMLRLRGGSARAGGLRPGEGIADAKADMHLTREFLAAAEFVRQMPGLSSEDKLVSMTGEYGLGRTLCGDSAIAIAGTGVQCTHVVREITHD